MDREHTLRLLPRALSAALVISLLLPAPVALARRNKCRSCDRAVPMVAITTPTDGSALEQSITVTGAASDNVAVTRVEVLVDDGDPVTASGTSDWSHPLDVSGLAPGEHTVTAVATDPSGNHGTTSVAFSVTAPTTGPWVTPEGVRIEINSAGPWTYAQIDAMLRASAVDLSLLGPNLTVKVQDQYASQTTVSASKTNGVYGNAKAIVYLKGVNSNFVSKPDAIMAHEYGHAWSLYHLYMTQQGNWTSYLDARGLSGDSRLDSSYSWDRKEILAEDYRLHFGSAAAISQMPNHMNSELTDPRQVAGLRGFLSGTWGGQP